MIALAVVADDLTGAADTGVQFCANFSEVVLVPFRHMEKVIARMKGEELQQALAVHTDTRPLGPHDARQRTETVARVLQPARPGLIYKKVDSCLRGNIGAETQALMEQFGFNGSAIAPAYPAMGRTTYNDIHLIRGIPVGQTEISADPVSPVHESHLSRIIASQSGLPVHRISIEWLEQDNELLVDRIDGILGRGMAHLVFDATEDRHLAAVAGLVLNKRLCLLPVGSAGLARAISARLPRSSTQQTKPASAVVPHCGHHLVVCGSTSEIAREQAEALVRIAGYQHLEVSPEAVCYDRKNHDHRVSLAREGARLLARSHLVVSVALTHSTTSTRTSTATSPQEIARGLGLLVDMLMRRTRPGSLFVTGGDTAAALLQAVGAAGLRLREEVLPGVVAGSILGGDFEGLTVVTKAGAFGDKNTLVTLHDKWYGEKTIDNGKEDHDGK